MRIFHSQNLSESRGVALRSIFWHGRAWYRGIKKHEVHCEWSFGKFASGFAVTLALGTGDSDDGLSFHACLPFLFSIFLCVDGVRRIKHPHKTGFAIHGGVFWLYPWVNEHEWNRSMPWWEKNLCWNFPWSLDWVSTEILEHKANLPLLADAVWCERKGRRNGFGGWNEREAAKASVSEAYHYTYKLKSGRVQNRIAKVYVDRMTWAARWWPLIPRKLVRTCINVQFSDEVGEGTGSWKGGCVGCGYEMRFGETPLETLRRMESERKFDR